MVDSRGPDVVMDVFDLARSFRFAEGLARVDQALEEGGLTQELALGRAQCWVGLQCYRDAWSEVQSLLEHGDESVRPASLVLKARILRKSSRYVDDGLEAAHEAALAASRVGPHGREALGEAWIEAARVFARKRCHELAERELGRAAEALPDDPRIGYHRGYVSSEFDDRPAAKQSFESILEQGSVGRYLGTLGLGYVAYVMGEFDAAHEQLEQLVPLPGGAIPPRRLRANLMQAEQRWPEAASALEEVIAASPKADGVWRDSYERACCLYRGGQIDDARVAYQALLDSAPERNYFGGLARRMAQLLSHPEAKHRPRRRLKAFPSVTQLRDHCGPASCELYLRFFGLTADQMEIARKIKEPDGGTPVYKMRRLLDDAGFETRRIEAELPRIKRLIDCGIPVIMEEAYSSSNHVAVAIGYDDARELLEVQDPMTHRVRETFYEDLAELRNLSNHGALVGVPKGDRELESELAEAGGPECRYISLVDEAWAAYDDDRKDESDALVAQSLALHREYEMAWFYEFRRARERAKEDSSAENKVELHRVLAEVTSIWPDDEWPQQLLGQVLFFEDRLREALVAFERARDRDDPDPYNWSMIADCHLNMGNYDKAHDALVEALARDPGYIRANENLADLAMRRGQDTMAWALNDAARELRPGNYFNHAIHGRLLEGDGQDDSALEAFDRALEIDAERDWVVTRKSRLLARMDRVDEAVAGMQSIVDRRPEQLGAKIDLADMLYSNDRAEQSIEVCEAMLEGEPKLAAAHAIMGAALGKLGRLEEALTRFGHALEQRPIYAWVYTQKGRLLLEATRPMEAIPAFAAALGMSGGSAKCEFDLGDALVRAGYDDEGVRHLREAAIHGELDEDQLCRVGELIVKTRSGNAHQFFGQVEHHRPDQLPVLRAHARTMLEVLWAPGAAAQIIEKIAAIAPEDPYALAGRGKELMDAAIETEQEGEASLRRAVELDPRLVYARRLLADRLNQRGRFADALEVIDPCPRSFSSDRPRVRAFLGLDRFNDAEAVIEAFRKEYGEGEDEPVVGALMLEYDVAKRRWDWTKALELAELISREMHERDDDGKLDRWEEERFECLVRLGQLERALKFGESQAVDAASLGTLAYSAMRSDELELAKTLAVRALRLDPDEIEALAVQARLEEVGGDADAALATWRRLREIDPDWHTSSEQIARIALGIGDLELAVADAEVGARDGHVCPWSFGVRAQARLLAGDREGAAADLERAWALASPQVREHDGHDVWGIRAGLAGDAEHAARRFEDYLAPDAPISKVDRQRIAKVREAIG